MYGQSQTTIHTHVWHALVTKLEIACGHHVSELRCENKREKRKQTVFPGPNPNPNPIPLVH